MKESVMLNKVIMIGRLTRDPEVRYSANGTPIVNFGLAVNNRRRENETMFVDCVAFNKQAESIGTYLEKGRLVCVEGRLQFRQWESQDGSKRSKHEIVADNVTFMGGGQGETNGNGVHKDEEPADVPF
jgi:single-strand DNA-binding protein